MKPEDSLDARRPRTAFGYPVLVWVLTTGLLALLIHDPGRPAPVSIPGTYMAGSDGFLLDMLGDGEARIRLQGFEPDARYRYQDGRVVVEARSQLGARVTWVFEVEHQALVSDGFRLNRQAD